MRTYVKILSSMGVFFVAKVISYYLLFAIYSDAHDGFSLSDYNFTKKLSFWFAALIAVLYFARYVLGANDKDKKRENKILSFFSYLYDKATFKFVDNYSDGNGIMKLIDRYQANGDVTVKQGDNNKTIAYFKDSVLIIDKKGNSILLSKDDVQQISDEWEDRSNPETRIGRYHGVQ